MKCLFVCKVPIVKKKIIDVAFLLKKKTIVLRSNLHTSHGFLFSWVNFLIFILSKHHLLIHLVCYSQLIKSEPLCSFLILSVQTHGNKFFSHLYTYCFLGTNDLFPVPSSATAEFLMIFFPNTYNAISGFTLLLGESCRLESSVEKYRVHLENT